MTAIQASGDHYDVGGAINDLAPRIVHFSNEESLHNTYCINKHWQQVSFNKLKEMKIQALSDILKFNLGCIATLMGSRSSQREVKKWVSSQIKVFNNLNTKFGQHIQNAHQLHCLKGLFILAQIEITEAMIPQNDFGFYTRKMQEIKINSLIINNFIRKIGVFHGLNFYLTNSPAGLVNQCANWLGEALIDVQLTQQEFDTHFQEAKFLFLTSLRENEMLDEDKKLETACYLAYYFMQQIRRPNSSLVRLTAQLTEFVNDETSKKILQDFLKGLE